VLQQHFRRTPGSVAAARHAGVRFVSHARTEFDLGMQWSTNVRVQIADNGHAESVRRLADRFGVDR
jgi:hypothetical protein